MNATVNSNSSSNPSTVQNGETVGARKGFRQGAKFEEESSQKVIWRVEQGAKHNYRRLAERLANCDDLFRHKSHELGLMQILPDGRTRLISKGADLAPVNV